MNIKYLSIFTSFIFIFSPNIVKAHPVDDQIIPDKVEIFLLAENEAPAAGTKTLDGLTGPAETTGVAGIDPLGIIDLAGEFPAMAGRQLRARVFTINPGGTVGIHTHNQRPGFAFILSGKIVEHRNDNPDPLVRGVGDVALEKNGITHWWENTFNEPVKALVVDIFTPDQ